MRMGITIMGQNNSSTTNQKQSNTDHKDKHQKQQQQASGFQSPLDMVEAEADDQSGVFLDVPKESSSSSSNDVKNNNRSAYWWISPSTIVPWLQSQRRCFLRWTSAGSEEHHKDGPLIVLPDKTVPAKKQKRTLIQTLEQAKDLPGTGGYFNIHIVVNEERTMRRVAPLQRHVGLDRLARQQATEMARSGVVTHASPDELLQGVQEVVSLPTTTTTDVTRVGENVVRGAHPRELHKYLMLRTSDRNNIVDRRFTHFGIGTVKGEDDQYYMCQVFCGP